MLPEHLQFILRQCPAFLGLFNRDGSIVWLSHADYGLDAHSLIGQPGDLPVLEEDRPIWWAAVRRCLRDRSVIRYRLRIGTPEPPYTAAIENRMGPVLVDGAVKYIFCVCWEVSGARSVLAGLPAGLPAGARWLSPTCERIVSYLDSHNGRWVKSQELSQGIGEPVGHRFKALLTNLVDRGILEARTGAGYRLARGDEMGLT